MSNSKAIGSVETESKKGFNSKDYNAIARDASLGMIRLAKVSFDCVPDFGNFENEAKLSVDRRCLASSVSDERDAVVAMFSFRVLAKHKRRTLLKGEAVYAVLYEIPEGSEEAAAQAFGRNVGQYAAYPYFRALMSQFAWSADANLPPLPVIASDPKMSVKREDKPEE